jgi:hypothetical protein
MMLNSEGVDFSFPTPNAAKDYDCAFCCVNNLESSKIREYMQIMGTCLARNIYYARKVVDLLS